MHCESLTINPQRGTGHSHFQQLMQILLGVFILSLSLTLILDRDGCASAVICCNNCSICGQRGKQHHGRLLTIPPRILCLDAFYRIPSGLRSLCSLQA